MATVSFTQVRIHGAVIVTWTDLSNDDDGEPYQPPVGYRLQSMQFTGTLGTGPTLTTQGSDEATPTNYGNLATATALGLSVPSGATTSYRPLIDGGSGSTITAIGVFSLLPQIPIVESNLLLDANAVLPSNDTDAITGWSSIATDVFESQSSVVDDGSFAFHANSNTTSSSGARIFKDITSLVNEGDTYEVEFRWRHVGTGAGWRAAIGPTSFQTTILVIDDVGASDTTFRTASGQWTQPAGNAFILFRENSGPNDGGVYVDKMTLTKV